MSKGLYLHVPFCLRKCAYCDFYSAPASEQVKSAYTDALIRSIKQQKERFDTLYIGGGTPTALGGEDLARIIKAALPLLENGAEITVEANPAKDLSQMFLQLKSAGVNRLSIGAQSFDEKELAALGRPHGRGEIFRAAEAALKAGIDNFSLDLMLGIPHQTRESLKESIELAASLGAKHVSCYMLKIEPGTPFFKAPPKVPDEDEMSELYLLAVKRLNELGFEQYEISNFAKKGHESRHNLHYWNDDEYLGLGPAAYSFLNGQRFHYPRDTEGFIAGAEPVFDEPGGDFEEYAMLRLRLNEGIKRADCAARFDDGAKNFDVMLERAQRNVPQKYLIADSELISLTPDGFLVSNAIIFTLTKSL